MPDGEQRFADSDEAKHVVLRTRRLFGALAARIADPALARRLEADLNDAWLRLQFARISGNPALVRVEERTCARLLAEVRRRAAVERSPG